MALVGLLARAPVWPVLMALLASLLIGMLTQLSRVGDWLLGPGAESSVWARALLSMAAVMLAPCAVPAAALGSALGYGRLEREGVFATLRTLGLSGWRLWRGPALVAAMLGASAAASATVAEPWGARHLTAIVQDVLQAQSGGRSGRLDTRVPIDDDGLAASVGGRTVVARGGSRHAFVWVDPGDAPGWGYVWTNDARVELTFHEGEINVPRAFTGSLAELLQERASPSDPAHAARRWALGLEVVLAIVGGFGFVLAFGGGGLAVSAWVALALVSQQLGSELAHRLTSAASSPLAAMGGVVGFVALGAVLHLVRARLP